MDQRDSLMRLRVPLGPPTRGTRRRLMKHVEIQRTPGHEDPNLY